MKKIILILLSITLISCNAEVSTSEEVKDRITYFKDDRTGLCFAQISSFTHSGFYTVSIATVPCDSVENFLIK